MDNKLRPVIDEKFRNTETDDIVWDYKLKSMGNFTKPKPPKDRADALSEVAKNLI